MMSNKALGRLEKIRPDFVREKAEKLSAPYSAPAIPVLEIAQRKSGVDVVFDPFNKFSGTVAGFCDFAEKKLYVNSNLTIDEQIFTMAHELGHWELHREFFEKNPEQYRVFPRFQRYEPGDPFEDEANLFASYLLVPTHLLRSVRNAPVASLASVFAVSVEVIENRLKDV